MEYKSILIQFFCFIQILNLILSQGLNIKKIGVSNFANVNLFKDFEYTLMGTSKSPYSDEKIIYDIGGNLFNIYEIEGNSLTINKNVSFSSNYTHRNFSGLSFLFDSCWISISGNQKLEIYNFTSKDFYYFTLEETFGFNNIVETGN